MNKWVVTINDEDCGYYVNHYATYYIAGEKPTPEDIVKLFNDEKKDFELLDSHTRRHKKSETLSSVKISIVEYKEPKFIKLGGKE